MKNILRYPLLALFVCFIFGYSLIDIFSPVRETSEMENRPLASKPKFSLELLLSNQYTLKYEEYTNDQFAFRDAWITLKSITESFLLKIENNGIIYGKDHFMFEKYLKTDEQRIEKNLGFVNAFADKNDLPITFALIPSSYMVLDEKIPVLPNNVNQTEFISSVYDSIQGKHVKKLDMFTPLYENRDSYIYYRTDHHWTTLGAYTGYSAYIKSLGLTPIEIESLSPNFVNEFYGTFFSKSKAYNALSDTITYYNVDTKEITIDDKPVDSLYDSAKFNERDKYAAFLHGNNGLTIIKSNNNLRTDPYKRSKILVVKDSYANSFIPFLTYHFDEVYVVDLRSITFKMSELLRDNRFDDILIMYSFMNFSSDTNIPKLTY